MNTPNNLKTATSTQRTMALKDFCDNAGTQLLKLREDAEGAQKAFNACLDHYGEDPKDKETDTNTFFALLKRFCDSWKKAEEENIKMEKLKREREMKKEFENNNQNAKENVFNKNAKTSSKENAAMLNAELKNKINNRNNRSVNHYHPEEVKVSYTHYPHFGVSPAKEKLFQRRRTKNENVVLTNISNLRMEHSSK